VWFIEPERKMVKKPLSQEASTKKPLLDHQRSQWLLGTGFLTSVKMSGGFCVIIFWFLGQKASKKPLEILILHKELFIVYQLGYREFGGTPVDI
jgi:hypothetical protein